MDIQAILQKVWDFLVIYGLKLIAAVIIFVIGKLVAKIIAKAVRRIVAKTSWGETLAKFVGNFIYFVLLLIVIIAALSKLGFQTTSFVAILGAAGLAVGLALQGSLANFASGVMLVIFHPFKVGDFIEAGNATGVVDSIDIFNTIIKTPDNKVVIVPNSQITGSKIVNYSTEPIRRVDLVFGIGYDDDLRKAKAILEEILQANEKVLKEPAYTVAVSELADHSVNFVVRPFVKTEDYWGVYFELTEAVKLRFDKEGITIPYPQTEVHLHQKEK